MSRFGGGGECGKSLRKSFRHAAKLDTFIRQLFATSRLALLW